MCRTVPGEGQGMCLELLVTVYQTTACHSIGDYTLHLQLCENFRTQITL
jgi:hypothetical protein